MEKTWKNCVLVPLRASETHHFERVSRLKGRSKKYIEKRAIFYKRSSPDSDWGASQNYLQRYPIISSSIYYTRFANPAEAARRRRTSKARLPLELGSDQRETSATRVSEDLQLSIFGRQFLFRRVLFGRKKSPTTFGRIRPIVPGFLRIWFRSEQFLGRLS